MKVSVYEIAGEFAEDKDVAAKLREGKVNPALKSGHELVLDFNGVRLTTQSFIHALISQPIRDYGEDSLDKLEFEGCSELVQGIIETVVQYSLESLEVED